MRSGWGGSRLGGIGSLGAPAGKVGAALERSSTDYMCSEVNLCIVYVYTQQNAHRESWAQCKAHTLTHTHTPTPSLRSLCRVDLAGLQCPHHVASDTACCLREWPV